METQHTPGPWYEAGTGDHQGLIISEANASVAVTYDKKDARLIAAAPDLLDALCMALPFVEDHEGSEIYKPKAVPDALKIIRAAIFKATEQTK